MNGPRLSTQAVEHFEDYMDCHDAAMADGRLCPSEHRQLGEHRQRIYVLLLDVDESIGLTVTMLRRGPESPSLKRRMVERGIRLAAQSGDEQTAA